MKRREHLVAGFPLIKFQSSANIASIRQGKIYMKTLKWYREHENENGDTIVGDEYEALWPLREAEITFPDTNEFIKVSNETIHTTFSNDFVFCMFGVCPPKTHFEYSETQKSELTAFGDTALLITDKNEFIKRMIVAAKKENMKLYAGFVRYYDPEADNMNMILSLMDGMYNIAFWKRKRYSLQQEYRFLLHSPNTDKDHFILDIGDISDISIVMKTSSALNARIEELK